MTIDKKLVDLIKSGDRRSLAKAMTLVESNLDSDRSQALELLNTLYKDTQNQALRIAISGIPGVGKSSFIEELGLFLTKKGLRVAVLAIDPTSPKSGGSILGDRTRMVRLSAEESVFIRPSPSFLTSGGVSRHTRELILLCEAAGYDIIIVETVGVGQGEYLAARMVDVFLLLAMPGTGDEIQGIKRGIYELANIIAITKSDGDLKKLATLAKTQHENTIKLLQKDEDWQTPIVLTSATEKIGIDKVWEQINRFKDYLTDSGLMDQTRSSQIKDWFENEMSELFLEKLSKDKKLRTKLEEKLIKLESQKIYPGLAAKQLIDDLF